MARDLKGKRIVLTGASGGIGAALAKKLAQAGSRLMLVSRSVHKLDQLAESLSAIERPLVTVADITKEEDLSGIIERVRSEWGALDVLINNAGIGSWAHFANSEEHILRQIMDVNFFAPAELIRRSVPLLTAGNQPAVVNVSSMCGRRAMPAWTEYSASKYALCGLTEALRGEFARFDIDVLLVVPGLTNSELPSHLLKSEGRYQLDFSHGMAPDEVAAGIVRGLTRNVTENVLGSDARWMLRVNRWFPRLVDYLVARRVTKLYQTS